ncbi:PEP-CTERM sorting domain-containing protein [uncultured Marinobacter sp.]|uniref:PEP-CTERM sorting domain-containing protein n=1 Tax=uncultured Marinobacter sp. TaxID=187379 RepID=UPI0025F38E97|nr:PEP-CTERM sorting domain-containing protein [uncultured Marinobacter sp.]
MSNRLFSVAIAGALLAGGAGVSNAAPVTVDLYYNGFSYSGPGDSGYKSGGISGAGGVRAGMFNFSVRDGIENEYLSWSETLDAYCVDTATYLKEGQWVSYTLKSAIDYFDSSALNDIDRLYGDVESGVNSGASSAAFQLALWEIVNEGQSGYSLDSGDFKSWSFGSVESQAEIWLDNLASDVRGFDFYVLDSDYSQDLLVMSPKPSIKVSEPGTLALLGVGIAAIGLRRRRTQ